LAKDNLSLLFVEGVVRRKQQTYEMIKKFGKQSHKEAIKSTDVFLNIIRNREHCPQINYFVVDCFDKRVFRRISVKADIIITDVPYGKLAS